MPVFEVLGGTRDVNATLAYCENEQVTNSEGQEVNKCALKAGVNCDIADIRSDFEETRNYFNKNGGRQGMHFALSFHKNELPNTLANQQKCLEMGISLADRIAKGHESGVFVHVDQDHLHCHIVTNSVAFQTGEKYHMEKDKDLTLLRHISDQVCKENGIEPLEMYKGTRSDKKGVEKRIIDRGGVTWKSEIVEAVKYAKGNALSEDHFHDLLAEKGVEYYQRGEKSFGYEHIRQREAGKTKFRMRDSNKALEGNHYPDVLKQIKINQRQQIGISSLEESPERTKKASAPNIFTLPPAPDDFEETIEHNQAKKNDIRANTSQQLAEAETEAKRAEIKEKEAFELQQAEIDKEIRLKESEFYKLIYTLQEDFSFSSSQEIEEIGDKTSFYFGGFTRKKYRVSLEREDQCLSFSKKEDEDYKELDVAFLLDQKDVKRLKRKIFNEAEDQSQQMIISRRQSEFEM